MEKSTYLEIPGNLRMRDYREFAGIPEKFPNGNSGGPALNAACMSLSELNAIRYNVHCVSWATKMAVSPRFKGVYM